MSRLLRIVYRIMESRALTPIVIGIFLLLYIGIAFFTEESLIVLIGLVKSNVILAAFFSLIPLNRLLRLVDEVKRYLAARRALRGEGIVTVSGLFDETVEVKANSDLAGVESRLVASGYATRLGEQSLAAWRGITLFPARALAIAASVCLFSGILLSLGGRTSTRGAVVEGAPLPVAEGSGGMVERIALEHAPGPIMAKSLSIAVASDSGSGPVRTFGLYPPGSYHGAFVYPRYLGIGLSYVLFAPDRPEPYESNAILNIYPPGKEDRKEVPQSPYSLMFSLERPDDGSDPYMTGRMTISCKLLKGDSVLASGSAPRGGEISGNGYRIVFQDIRRAVLTDFISDRGVIPIWAAGMMFMLAIVVWLPVRCLAPRRELLFVAENGVVRACSRAEGQRRKHAGVFHDALDAIETIHMKYVLK